MAKAGFIPQKLRPWIEVRKKYRLSHAQVQMARELGLNSKKFRGLANYKQEPWKIPLPDYIEELYFKHFNKKCPDIVRSIEQMVKDKAARKAKRKEERVLERPVTHTQQNKFRQATPKYGAPAKIVKLLSGKGVYFDY